MFHTLSVLSSEPDTTRRPSRDTATQRTYNDDTSSQKYYKGDAATHSVRVPFQRRHALAGRHAPHLERLVPRRRHDAPPVRKHGNARDLRRRHIITKVQRTPQRTLDECPSIVARHLPVATSHTLSVLSPPSKRPEISTWEHGRLISGLSLAGLNLARGVSATLRLGHRLIAARRLTISR